jgi:Zn/Cd-binding protein ZinT
MSKHKKKKVIQYLDLTVKLTKGGKQLSVLFELKDGVHVIINLHKGSQGLIYSFKLARENI